MGLDISYDVNESEWVTVWCGAYSGFTRWRNTLAEVAGYLIWEVKSDIGHWPTIIIDWGHLPDGSLQGIWDKTPDDPLVVIIAHSDCDGHIYPAQMLPLADRLEELLPEIPDELDMPHRHSCRGKTEQFIKGLRGAFEVGKTLDFG